MVLLSLLTSCGTGSKLTKAERKAYVEQYVLEALDKRQYTIAVDWMRPLGGRPKHLTSNYELKIDGDDVNSYLPFQGRAYNVPYGGGKALNFTGKIDQYQTYLRGNDLYHIEFQVTNDEDTYVYHIEMFSNGKATIDVIPRERSAISFDGEMLIPEPPAPARIQ